MQLNELLQQLNEMSSKQFRSMIGMRFKPFILYGYGARVDRPESAARKEVGSIIGERFKQYAVQGGFDGYNVALVGRFGFNSTNNQWEFHGSMGAGQHDNKWPPETRGNYAMVTMKKKGIPKEEIFIVFPQQQEDTFNQYVTSFRQAIGKR